MMRSKLFVPGSRPDLFSKAAGSAADAISFDLEDSVPPEGKAKARINVAAFLHQPQSLQGKTVIVRVNALDSGFFEADVDALAGPGLHVINVPKVESKADIERAVAVVAHAGGGRLPDNSIGILANVETPRGLRLAAEIATANRMVIGLQIGFKDLFAPWGIDGSDPVTQHLVRLQVRLAAAEGGIFAYDGAFSDIKDPEGFRAEAETARCIGFAGKTCIHPSQIAIANEVFSPRPEEIAFAENVLAAAGEAADRGQGAFTVGGEMIDSPTIARAKEILSRASATGQRNS
jgi:citrate lyase subunit beta / citryl-CoA lyase